MAQRVGDGGVRAHRVTAEQEALLPHLGGDDPLEVGDQRRVSITLPRRGGVGLAVAARVVGDDPVAGPLQRPRAVDDVAAAGGEAVAEDDRGPLPARPRRGSPAPEPTDECGWRGGRPSADGGDGLLEVVDRLVS